MPASFHGMFHGHVGGSVWNGRMTPTTVLLTIYIAAALIEVAGIALTVGTYIEFKDGLGTVHQPESKLEALRGPVLIASGVIVGLGGNIASLYLAI